MAADSYGTAHLYGVSGTISTATVLSTSFDEERRNQDETANESGIVIERRYDDTHTTGTITIRIQAGYTIPSAGDTIAYDSTTYEITGVGRTQEQRGMREVTIAVLKSEGITYA